MRAWRPILPSGYCPPSAHLLDVDIMGVDNTSPRNLKSIQKKLAELYARRLAVESLIRCLESYAECQAKHESRESLALKTA